MLSTEIIIHGDDRSGPESIDLLDDGIHIVIIITVFRGGQNHITNFFTPLTRPVGVQGML